jgi:uncharacterized protein (TIGR00369 family)
VNVTTVLEFIKEQWPELAMNSRLTCHRVTATDAHLSQTIPTCGQDTRPGGFISGPTQFAMADVGMWVQTFGAKGLNAMAMTSEMSIRFLRPAIGDALQVETAVNSLGSRSVVMTATLWTDDRERPTAVAQGTYVMPR